MARDDSELPDRAVLVLTSLADGAKHGYALIRDIEEFSGTRLGPGTLYGALARLEREALVRPLPAQARRHPYEITDEGRARLATHLQRSARIARIGLRRVGVQGA
jgi:DNA-binding PadR family transcriptional regulator